MTTAARKTTRELAAYLKVLDLEGDWTLDEWEKNIATWSGHNGNWRLTSVRVDLPWETQALRSSERVVDYASRATPYPAIVVAGRRVVDGNHRLAAAAERGDRRISAWVPLRGRGGAA